MPSYGTRDQRRLLVLVATLAVALGACGGGGVEPRGQRDRGVGDLPDLAGQSIEVAAVWTGDEQQRFQDVLRGFEERTGATVSYSSFGDNPGAFLGTRISGGNPPDVAVLAQPGVVQDFVSQGALQPIDDVAGDLVESNYAPVWRELGTYNGKLYGVWFKAANKSTWWYDVATFNRAGVRPPGSWDELKKAAETLTAYGVAPFAIGGANGWVLTDWFENVYLRTAGRDKYDQLAKHELPWTDESVKQALRTLADVWGRREWLAGQPLQVTFSDSVTQVYAEPPLAATVFEGFFVAGVIESQTNAVLGTDADFFPFPSLGQEQAEAEGPVVVGGDQAVLMQATEGGKALIRFLASPEAAETWAAGGGFLSPNQALDASVYPDDLARRAAEALTEAEVVRFDLSDLQPSAFGATSGQGMWKLFQDFLATPSNVDGIAQQLEAAASRAFQTP